MSEPTVEPPVEPPAEPPVELGILAQTKKALNVAVDDTTFDIDLILFINGVFSDLNQLGIGPNEGFEIEDDTAKWSDFLGKEKRYNSAKSYMINSVRLKFDPPDSYFVVQALKEQIEKDEFRLNFARESMLDSSSGTAGTSSPSVDFMLTAGLPYNRKIRAIGAAKVWPTLEDFEVLSQIRSERSSSSRLLGSLLPYLSASIDGDDIVLDLEMTGAQTRQTPEGFYDIIISDPGSTDLRAISVLSGRVVVGSLVTGVS